MPYKTDPPLYSTWREMLRRCENPKSVAWCNYGGRGITVCERWKSYRLFEADMGERPPGYTLERIDNDKGYSPENCRWATRKEQQRNQRVTRRVKIEGVEYLAVELSEHSGIKTDTIINRAGKGMTLEQVLAKTRYAVAPAWRKAVENSLAIRRARTHCKNGHPFSGKNLHVTAEGWRRCRRCKADRENVRRKRLVQA